MHSTSEIRVRTQNRNRSSGKRQTVPEINWGELEEVVNVAYPEFSGPEHGPVHNFDVDSEPVVFLDQLFTDELWDQLVTETNSIALCKTLKGFRTYTVGTLRSNRLGYPKCLTDKPLLKTMKQGDYHSATAEGITVTVWKDTKDVSFLSNVHSSTGQDNVSRKKQGGSVVAITAPPVVQDYNENMGAIDKNDQLKKTYAIDCKSKKWWMRIFFHLLDICRLNSFIMYQQCYLSWNSGPVEEDVAPMMDQKSFTSTLVNSLRGTYHHTNSMAALLYHQFHISSCIRP
ncbi:PiggyBac transposable element-derived protein 1 [Stylophora pistillata]|uniref:PiggyBac transposable element-derived protein 1 n=1 Tax=Stylophora pistillata TaxID=50429 RepID=A0A2B4R9W6_STYPI|nr:PiggyBac transposable element-derived protein 1 [Stylophora pistillata]